MLFSLFIILIHCFKNIKSAAVEMLLIIRNWASCYCQSLYYVDAKVVLIFCYPQKFYHMQCWSHFDSLLQNLLCVTNYMLLTVTLACRVHSPTNAIVWQHAATQLHNK